jgi:hypothetical protein
VRLDRGVGAGPGTFDQVWQVADADGAKRLIVVEAKGGSSELGSRAVGGGTRAEQGTRAYFNSIVDTLRDSEDPKLRALGRQLRKMDPDEGVRYLHSRTPISTSETDRSLADLIRLREFDINKVTAK